MFFSKNHFPLSLFIILIHSRGSLFNLIFVPTHTLLILIYCLKPFITLKVEQNNANGIQFSNPIAILECIALTSFFISINLLQLKLSFLFVHPLYIFHTLKPKNIDKIWWFFWPPSIIIMVLQILRNNLFVFAQMPTIRFEYFWWRQRISKGCRWTFWLLVALLL